MAKILKEVRWPVLVGAVIAVALVGIGILGYLVVNFAFPAQISTIDAIEILKAIVGVDGVLLGFLGIMFSMFFASNNSAIDRLGPILTMDADRRKRELVADRQSATIVAAASFGLLIFSVLTSIAGMASIPEGSVAQTSLIDFTWPIGFLMSGLIMLVPYLVSIGLVTTGL